jgi:5-methylcytosine-specific restriction protein A
MNKPPCIEENCIKDAEIKGRCMQHQLPAYSGNFRKERLPSDWQARRKIVFQRDEGICYLCGNPGADTIDHIIPNDDHNLDNLAPVHDRTYPHCHKTKTNQEANNAIKGSVSVQWARSWAEEYRRMKEQEKNQ